MIKSFSSFLIFFLVFQLSCNEVTSSGNIVQVSKASKNSEVRTLKATLLPCLEHDKTKCKSQLNIKAWLDLKSEHEIFMLIDEAYDINERMNVPLMHPYLIQVSTSEQTLSYPLILNQVVNVSCNESEMMQRREADNDRTLADEGDKTDQEDLLNAIRMEEDTIRKDFPTFISENDAAGENSANGNDLLLYFHDAMTSTEVPWAGHELDTNAIRHHDIKNAASRSFVPSRSGSISSERNKIQIHFNENTDDNQEPQNENQLLVFNSDYQEPRSLPIDLTTNSFPRPNTFHKNQHHQLTSPHRPSGNHKNRFPINQHESKTFEVKNDEKNSFDKPTSPISDSKWTKIKNENRFGDVESRNLNYATENLQKFPADVQVFTNGTRRRIFQPVLMQTTQQLKDVDKERKLVVVENANEISSVISEPNHYNQTDGRNYHKLLQQLHKSSAVDNRNLPIDLSLNVGRKMKQLNDAHKYQQRVNGDGSEYRRHNDREIMENDDFHYTKDDKIEPTDDEDNPNLLIVRKSLKNQQKLLENLNYKTSNSAQIRSRCKRFSRHDAGSARLFRSQVGRNDKPTMNKKFSVYTFSSPPIHYSSSKIQVFRKIQSKWVRMNPEVNITNESANYTNGNFHISTSARKSFSNLFDIKRTLLLVPTNEASLGSLLTLNNQLMAVSTDKIRHAICPSSDELSPVKRSVKKLQDSGLLPKQGDAIRRCPSNLDQFCLNLKDDEAPTLKLEIQLPFLHNEILDIHSASVKISNIFIDTSDGSNLLAQFDITSMDHFTKRFKLTITECALLDQLNISHSMLLPPNKSTVVNLTVPLPFYAEHQNENCEVNIINEEGKVVARRGFVMNPKGARCVCLWHCACFCFGSFLTTEAKSLCQEMTPKNEIYAGFYDAKSYAEFEDEVEQSNDFRKHLMMLPLVVFLSVLLLGLLKGLLGCWLTQVGIWKFNYVHPCLNYRETSRCRRFMVNLLFFFLLPIAWCSSFCCCSSLPKHKINSDSSIRGRKVSRKEFYSDENSSDENDVDEEVNLLKPAVVSSDFSSVFGQYRRSSETVFDVRDASNSDDAIEKDTRFVVNAINESHESLRKLESHHSELNTTNDSRFHDAQKLVKSLLAARIAYRRFNESKGFVRVNDNQAYSIRGYFIPAQGTGYQFITYNPIRQVYEVTSTLTMVSLAPQISLDSKAFRRFYANKIEVLEANDLSVHPSPSAPCVNVLVQDHSMYGT